MKGVKNVSGMETFYFRNKMTLVVCGSLKKKSLEIILGIRNYENARDIGEWIAL